MKKFSKRYLNYAAVLLLGLLLGWLLFHRSGDRVNSQYLAADTLQHSHEQETVWTCAMHPQVRQDHPGKCPICGMDLVPLNGNSSPVTDPGAISMTREAAALANVETTIVSRQNATRDVRLYGKIQADERLYQSQVAHVPGRIERLAVNFTGEKVSKGQLLAEIYSPELVTAQHELLETAKTKKLQPELYEASRERLKQWKLSEDQIDQIESTGNVINDFRVLSNTSGTVTARRVNSGDYVAQGTVLYEIADLSTVWAQFDAYESDLGFLEPGKKITFVLQALPGEQFSGVIAFIDPVIDPVTRAARVRVEVPNRSGKLKPEMFATGTATSGEGSGKSEIVIPRSAVLWTGKRSIVYVRQPGTVEPVFRMREIVLGQALGMSYVVESGLREGEEIVTNGTFSVDASAQLAGKPSMMNPGDGQSSVEQGQVGAASGRNERATVFEKVKVPSEFLISLNKAYDSYNELKNSLVSSDYQKSRQSGQKLQKAFSGLSLKLLPEDAREKWTGLVGNLEKSSAHIASATNLDEQRKEFAVLSEQMYTAVKTFGLRGKTVFYQFCPMFNNNAGGFWLSENREIRNPFFGDEMLTCGETREEMKF